MFRLFGLVMMFGCGACFGDVGVVACVLLVFGVRFTFCSSLVVLDISVAGLVSNVLFALFALFCVACFVCVVCVPCLVCFMLFEVHCCFVRFWCVWFVCFV